MRRAAFALVALAFGAGSPDAGAQPASVTLAQLYARPLDAARRFMPNTKQSSELRTEDAALGSGARAATWHFEGKQGERVRISLQSGAFDAYLYLGRHGVQESAAENDDADGTNSEVSFTLPEDGTYVIVASSFEPNATGEYSLSLEVREPAPGMTGPVTIEKLILRDADPMQTLGLDRRMGSQLDAKDGRMADSSRFELWHFTARAGDVLDVTVEATDFPAAVAVARQGATAPLAQNADRERAAVRVTAPEDGVYVIVVRATRADALGNYTLGLHRRPR